MASVPVKHERAADRAAWADETARLVECGAWSDIDRRSLASELQELSRSEYNELRSRLRVVIAHLLKTAAHEGIPTASWRATIIEQRSSILDALEESPSLRSRLGGAAYRRVWERAVELACAEAPAQALQLQAARTWDLDQVLREEFWPDTLP